MSWDIVEKIVELCKRNPFKILGISGLGEPFVEQDKLLYVVEKAAVPTIEIVTSGYWASSLDSTRKVIGLLNDAVNANSHVSELHLTVSVDIFHQEKIPIANILHVITVLSELNETSITLRLLGIKAAQKWRADPIKSILHRLNIDRMTTTSGYAIRKKSIDAITDFMEMVVYLKNIKFKVEYMPLGMLRDLSNDQQTAENVDIRGNLNRLIMRAGISDDGMELDVNPEGDAVFSYANKLFDTISSGNILNDSLAEIKAREDKDPFIRAIREEGVGYIADIAMEVDPQFIQRADKYNYTSGVTIEILKNPYLFLYITKRLIKIDIELGLIDPEPFDELVKQSNEELQNKYYEQTGTKRSIKTSEISSSDKSQILVLHEFDTFLHNLKSVMFRDLNPNLFEIDCVPYEHIQNKRWNKVDVLFVHYYMKGFNNIIRRNIQRLIKINPNMHVVIICGDTERFSSIEKEFRQSLIRVKNLTIQDKPSFGSILDGSPYYKHLERIFNNGDSGKVKIELSEKERFPVFAKLGWENYACLEKTIFYEVYLEVIKKIKGVDDLNREDGDQLLGLSHAIEDIAWARHESVYGNKMDLDAYDEIEGVLAYNNIPSYVIPAKANNVMLIFVAGVKFILDIHAHTIDKHATVALIPFDEIKSNTNNGVYEYFDEDELAVISKISGQKNVQDLLSQLAIEYKSTKALSGAN